MKKLLIICSFITLLFGCKKEESDSYPLAGTYYLKAFGTSIYCIESGGIIAQGGKTFQVKLKPASQPFKYYVVSAADESKAFENVGGVIQLNTIASPESIAQVFAFVKASNVDAYYIVPDNSLNKTLATDLPPTLTFAIFLREKTDTDADIEGRFVLEP